MMDGWTISLTYLLPELIELIGEYLTPTDVRALRSVNRYCHSIFNSDNYWKKYLTYPEKYFLCDLKSQSKTPGIAEVVEEITEGRVSKWLGYLKLQKIHLKNWYCGKSEMTTITLGSKSVCDAKDIVDDFNEHWLFLRDISDVVFVWNITAKPRALEPLSITSVEKDDCKGMTLSPQGKALFQVYDEDEDATYFDVYVFSNSALTLTFEHRLHSSLNSDVCSQWNRLIVCDKYLVYSCPKQSGEHFIKMWDWHMDQELATVDLSKEKLYQDLKASNAVQSEPEVSIRFFEGSFPNIILSLCYGDLQHISIFNLKRRKLTHVVDTVTGVISCEMKWNKICVRRSSPRRGTLSVYTFTSNQVELLYECINIFSPVFRITKTKIIFIYNFTRFRVIDTSQGKELMRIRDFSVPIQNIVGFIEPNLLVIKCTIDSVFKVLHMSFKDQGSVYERTLPITLLHHTLIPTYPSKLITWNYIEDALCVHTF